MRKKVEKNTAAKKTVEKKTVSAVKAAEPEVKVEEKTEVKTVEAVSEEAKPEVQAAEAASEIKAEEKPVAKKAAKPATAKKATKAAAKKETEAKPAKTAKVAASQKIVLQMSGRDELSVESIIERVKKAYADEGHSTTSIKNVEVYIKPEEGMAYYVIDGYASGISLY